MSEPLLWVGASVRAAVFASQRAGVACQAIDHYGDWDLTQACSHRTAAKFPCDVVKLAAQMPHSPFCYTGPMENYPALLSRCMQSRTLLGNGPEQIACLRDPLRLSMLWRSAGIDFPEVRPSADGLPLDGSWLIKPVRSAGGAKIAFWNDAAWAAVQERRGPKRGPVYFQQFLPGRPCSAICLAWQQGVRVLAVSYQLVGPTAANLIARDTAEQSTDLAAGLQAEACLANTAADTGQANFQYAGSLMPAKTDILQAPRCQAQFHALAQAVCQTAGLRGLFGVDAILTGDKLYPVEVNPRWPASAELLARGSMPQVIRWHVAACRQEISAGPAVPAADHWLGKQIVYAPRQTVIDAVFPAWCADQLAKDGQPKVADISPPGTVIPAGGPMVTVFGQATTEAALRLQLRHLTGQVMDRLRPQ